MIDFKNYDAANPQIWAEFKKFCFLAKERGYTHWSAKGVFEVIRWNTPASDTTTPFKVCNNFTPDYARKMMKEYPEFEGFFRIKQLKASRT
tara:strand:- start:32 stop:304 length:273 start_codon:yes stop_codon:yes gene_type:complete